MKASIFLSFYPFRRIERYVKDFAFRCVGGKGREARGKGAGGRGRARREKRMELWSIRGDREAIISERWGESD